MKVSLRKRISTFVQRQFQIERHSSKRIAPVHRTLCLIQSSGEERIMTLVHNISCTGVAVQAERPYAPGTLLHLLLINEAHTFSLAVDLNVVRSLRIDDQYLVAGTFVRPLLHKEITPFIL